MTRNQTSVSHYQVTLEQASLHARFAMISAGVGPWSGGRLRLMPDLIFDPSGVLLLYQYYVLKDLDCVGVIRVAADQRLSTPVISVQSDRPYQPDFSQLNGIALALVAERYPHYRPIDLYLVAYCYPKLGLQIELVRKGFAGDEHSDLSVVVDAQTKQIVEELPEGAGDGEELDGNEVYSLIKLAHVGPSRLKSGHRLSPATAHADRHVSAWKMSDGFMKSFLECYEDSEGAKHEDIMSVEELVLPAKFGGQQGVFPLVAQIGEYHCALATAEMIIEFLTNLDVSQTELEEPFRKGPFGTSNTAQVTGYAEILKETEFGPAPVDKTPSPEEAIDQIGRGFPMKSGVPRHARACCGYRKTVFKYEGKPEKDSFELLIHDPYPPNEGRVYWESWNEIIHTNFLYLKRK